MGNTMTMGTPLTQSPSNMILLPMGSQALPSSGLISLSLVKLDVRIYFLPGIYGERFMSSSLPGTHIGLPFAWTPPGSS